LDTQLKNYVSQHPDYLYMMGVSYEQTKQPAKGCGAYGRLLKLMKPKTKEYKQIQVKAAADCKPVKKKH